MGTDLAELWTPSLDVPQGHVIVELRDERGRITQREEADNFISVFSIEVLKQYQRFAWAQYFPGTRNYDAWGRTCFDLPGFPIQTLCCWNDATAENPSTEKAMFNGPIVAYASRFPQGSPTGGRGVINITESIATTSVLTFVFDWLTSNGNGTFQSVGWSNLYTGATPLYPTGIHPDPFFGAPTLTFNITTPTTYYGHGLWHDGTNWLTMHTVGQSSGTSGMAIYSIDPTTGVGTLLLNIPTADYRYQNGISSPPEPWDLCKIGTDFYVIGYTGSGTRVSKYNSSGVQQWQVDHTGGASQMPSSATGFGHGITTDGTSLYVAFGSLSGTINHRVYKLSASTGLVVGSAVVPALLSGSTLHCPTDIAWDGTNLRIITANGLLFTMDPTTGATVNTDPVVQYTNGRDIETVTSPFPGSGYHTNSYMNMVNLMNFGDNQNTGTMAAMNNNSANGGFGMSSSALGLPGQESTYRYGGGMVYRGGKLYCLVGNGANGAITTPNRLTELTYASIGSRTKLASPVTKDSSKTMKITYTLTFA